MESFNQVNCRIAFSGVSKVYQRPRQWTRTSLWDALIKGAERDEQVSVNALHGINLVIEEGERVGIIGANGAGKSTLLHLLAGTAEPSSGTVAVNGHVHAVLTLGAVLREEATGRENIYIDGEIQGRSRSQIEKLMSEMIEFSELGDFIDRPVRTYSSGMKARLAFTMIAHLEPEILVIDEVLSVGDVHFSRKATERMRSIAARGRIVVVVSHGMQSIVEMCTRCIWIENGRIRMDGTPAKVTEAYIAHVHATDQSALANKFSRIDHPTGRDGAKLESVHVIQNGRPTSVAVAGESTSIRVTGDAKRLESPGIDLTLLRIDGTLILEKSVPTELSRSLGGPFEIDSDFGRLSLGPSVYRADVSLTENGERQAGASTVFEVRTNSPLIGGVPMLFYPSECIVSTRFAAEV